MSFEVVRDPMPFLTGSACYFRCVSRLVSRGEWTCALGPTRPIRYPVDRGTLLFLVTERLLPWVMYIPDLVLGLITQSKF